MWDGLGSGCLPIYRGAPEIRDYLPDKRAVIHVDDFPDKEQLAEYLKQVMRDEALYNSHFQWRKLPLSQLQAGYLELKSIVEWKVHERCVLCRMLATPGAKTWRDVWPGIA